MKKPLLLCFTLLALAVTSSAQNKPSTYGISCSIFGDSLSVAVWCYWDMSTGGPSYALLSHSCTILVVEDDDSIQYSRHGDTLLFLGRHDTVRFVYNLPLSSFRSADGVINLHREDNWYPHRNDEVEYVYISTDEDDYYTILNGELLDRDVKREEDFFNIEKKSDGLHLIFLSKK